jgi:uncharacterized protein (TIGR03083 family)
MSQPIHTAHLFPELDGMLLELLESIAPDDWRLPTVVPGWNVKQVAAHLLDTALRRLSLGRDRESVPGVVIRNDGDVAALVNRLNAEGVEVYGRLSPRVLMSLMREAARELAEYLSTLDPMAPAAIGVSWAGEQRSLSWFDVARELTERWHHQQQIRLAVDRPGILTARLYAPVLDCFMRGLPHAYRETPAATGDVVRVRVSGECGGEWSIQRQTHAWLLVDSPAAERIVSTVTIPQEIAWRIFTKGISPEQARPRVAIAGDERLGSRVLHMRSIVG